jgi:hypothetical protein
MAGKATGGTAEKVPVPVASIGAAALRAALAGMAGVNVNHGYAALTSLVLDKPA